MKSSTINFIQDIATPHNNLFIKSLIDYSGKDIKIWYAQGEEQRRYNRVSDLTNEISEANIYGSRLNLRFLLYCLRHRKDKFLIVGWANINTMLLHVMFFLLRVPYNHWTDLPDVNENLSLKNFLFRWGAYKSLELSKCKVFGVGSMSILGLKGMGFDENRLANLPIFVKTYSDLGIFKKKEELFEKYNIPNDFLLISAGSRLVYEKGYDILLSSIALLPSNILSKTKLILIGDGEQLNNLKKLSISLGISQKIIFIEWIEIDSFKCIIANSDVFVHPARFDSYGGSILAMSLGVPVIGSYGSGAAVDRVNHGKNGFLYSSENSSELSKYIELVLSNKKLRMELGVKAHQKSLEWPTSRGVEILMNNMI